MFHKHLLSLFFTVFIFIHLPLNANITEFFEPIIFGSTIADEEYQALFDETKSYYGVAEDHKLYYARWPWTYFASFTLHSGTWINKVVWGELDFDEQIYTIYHEIAHKALAHPLKQYMLTLGTFIISAYFSYKIGTWNKKTLENFIEKIIVNKWGVYALKEPFVRGLIGAVVTTITSLVSTVIVNSIFNKYCEQEADEKASIALCEQDRVDVVERQIKYLEEIKKEKGDIKSFGFPSISNQIKYLKKIVNI